jgi:glycosyltransferase involved in cell wall biosynthesis
MKRETRRDTMTDGLIAPHGGELIVNRASEAECLQWQVRAKDLPQVVVGSRQPESHLFRDNRLEGIYTDLRTKPVHDILMLHLAGDGPGHCGSGRGGAHRVPCTIPEQGLAGPSQVKGKNEMRMRILVNYGRPSPLEPEQASPERKMSGIRTAAVALCAALVRRGHEVHLFSRCSRPGVHQGVCFHDRSSFARFTETQPVDVLVVVPEVLPLLMPVRARVRLIWSGNAFEMGDCALAEPWSWAPQLGRAGETARLYSMAHLHQYADRLVVKSEWQARDMQERLGIPAGKFTVAYNGVPLEFYGGSPPERNRYRLVYTSQARRGLDVLLRLFPRIRMAVPHAELHVFGCEYKVAGLDGAPPTVRDLVQDGVFWHGALGKRALASELCMSGLMAYPCTFKETFCTAVAEAQAAGLPVVTSAHSALTERVTDSVDGLLIRGNPHEPDYERAFVAAVVQLLQDDQTWRRMSAEAARKARRLYDWDVIAAEWEQEMQCLVTGREPEPPTLAPSLDLVDPELLRLSEPGASAEVPAALASQWLRAAWASYGYEPSTVPGLPGRPFEIR